MKALRTDIQTKSWSMLYLCCHSQDRKMRRINGNTTCSLDTDRKTGPHVFTFTHTCTFHIHPLSNTKASPRRFSAPTYSEYYAKEQECTRVRTKGKKLPKWFPAAWLCNILGSVLSQQCSKLGSHGSHFHLNVHLVSQRPKITCASMQEIHTTENLLNGTVRVQRVNVL